MTESAIQLVRDVAQFFVSLAYWYADNFSFGTKIAQTAVASIFYLIYDSVQNPQGAINTFMILLIDIVYEVFPQTPDQYKIASLLSSFAVNYPQIGWGTVYEIFHGMSVMFGLWCVVKLWQLLPFT